MNPINNNNDNDNHVDLEEEEDPHFERAGRVVRLHFTCRAELPLGSFLRVTGSTLWAPGTAVNDPADAAVVVDRTEAQAFAAPMETSQGESLVGSGQDHATASELYTSSVEMVTTPEEYPVWRTRRPVVIVLPQHRKHITYHHYYRYLIVSPGGKITSGFIDEEEGGGDQGGGGGGGEIMEEDTAATPVVSTSNEGVGSTAVIEWEDPFLSQRAETGGSMLLSTSSGNNMNSASNMRAGKSRPSAVSLASSVIGARGSGLTKTDLRNLPYRTVDIDLTTAQPESVAQDRYNEGEDVTFQHYLIREAIHEENRRKLVSHRSHVSLQTNPEENDAVMSDTSLSRPSSIGGQMASTGGPSSSSTTGTPPPPASLATRIFFICFHLPVVVVQNPQSKQWRASWSESILAKTEGSQILSTYQAYWVGTVTSHPPLQTQQDKEAVRSILEEMNCIPIFLDDGNRQAHYYGFCKQVLWPAFHNIDMLDLSTCGWLPDQHGASDWDQSRLDDWWNAYTGVNQEFCRVMGSLIKPADILWIHDYHLSLLPQQMSAVEIQKFGRRVTRKVFFLHIPFPTSQIFREIECGESILKGMLHADVVGFHAFDHARHFLNAAKRILGCNYESLVGGLIGVNFQGKTILVSMSNVSIEPRMVDAALMLPSVQAGKDELRNKHHGRTIVGGLDIGQRLSGISLKLLAFERLLQDYPLWQSRVVMMQRVLLPGSRQKDEEVTTQEVRVLVKRIQEKFGNDVIDYQEVNGTSLPMDQRLAFWKAIDILMVTPIREGLNHWPMEFIYAHKEPEKPGVVIASEFSAISSILNGALRVNPYDIQMMIATIDKALSMEMHEREGRRYRDIEFVSSSPSDKWVKNVLRDLKDATIRQPSATTASESNSQASTPYSKSESATPIRKELVDNTAAFLAREASLAFAHLNIRAVKRAYDSSQRRVIITDFNGTIVPKEPPGKYLKREILGTSGNKPPQVVIDALGHLCSDPKNTVYVVSGDSVENVLSALGHIPNLGLAVSNGARFSPPGPVSNDRKWLTFDLGVDWDAVKRVALPVLSKYTARSNGSFVKLTSFSIGWSYYSCDPEWGSLQASHLVLELETELRAFDVRFVTLKGIVEVVPRKLNKGLIVTKVLRDVGPAVDFCLCMGDDISDEKMFTSVFSFLAESGQDPSLCRPGPPVLEADGTVIPERDMSDDMEEAPDRVYSFTVAVGRKQSHASFFVNGADDVANTLVTLAGGNMPAAGLPTWGSTRQAHLFS